jgi:hypothetical protein
MAWSPACPVTLGIKLKRRWRHGPWQTTSCGYHNRPMFHRDNPLCTLSIRPATVTILLVACAGILGSACTPAFNWRDVAFEDLPVAALLPCKPDRATRTVPLAGAPRQMVMAGCAAGGATFTVAVVTVADSGQLAPVLAELKAVNKATHSRYQSHGLVAVQASVYGEPKADWDGPGALNTQAVETFLGGVKLAGTP